MLFNVKINLLCIHYVLFYNVSFFNVMHGEMNGMFLPGYCVHL